MNVARCLLLTAAAMAPFGCSRQSAPPAAESASPAESPTTAERGTAASAPAEEAVRLEPQISLTQQEIEDGWIQLFDGQTLFGWKANNDVNWTVHDGTIRADQGEPGLLLTTVPFADFELRCDFRLEKGGNSGVFLRTPVDPKNPAVDCYELNICDSHPEFQTGSLVGRVKTPEPVRAEGEWKTFHIRAEGPHIQVRLDGKEILDFHGDPEAEPFVRNGFIGLQKNAGKVEFRNIRLRPLGTAPIFNGKDLAGWREVPGSKSEFEAVDGTIHVTNGRGFLETEATWDDFILQADVITNGEHLNSGIFFRALPGTEAAPSHGYEMQIHNGFRNGDRSRPMDFGTGAIFRRNQARWVVPDDRKWFTATLVAYGPRFSVWINGYQVTEWVDDRAPSDNPREGKKLAAGHISLQGHDPTTDLAFRNLRVAGYPDDAER